MKWYKHMTNGLDDEVIQDLMHDFGSDAYVAWFGLLEMAGSQVDEHTTEETWYEIPPHRMKRKMHISKQKLQKIFGKLSENFNKTCEKPKLLVNFSLENWKFQIPKLLEIKDNHISHLQATYKSLTPLTRARVKNIRDSSSSPVGTGELYSSNELAIQEEELGAQAQSIELSNKNGKGDSRVSEFFKFWEDRFVHYRKIKPTLSFPRCGKQIKERLRDGAELAEMQQMAELFLSGVDTFADKAGFTLEAFLAPAVFQKMRLLLKNGSDSVNEKNRKEFVAMMQEYYDQK